MITTGSGEQAVVLVADDSATVRALVSVELEAAGYRVLEAVDGRAALAAAVAHTPDVVLLDVEMPVMDGHQTVRALKADPRTADVPVVFLTGRLGSADVAEALQLGAHDYLRKPPEAAELLARVAAALRVKTLQDELRRMSRTDHLTGLFNRRHLEEHMRRSGAASRRHGHELAVLIVDVDHFKKVNDGAGHAAGDLVLQHMGQRLQQSLRLEDLLGRWGGEEFIVLAAHTGLESARRLGQRLCEAVRADPFPLADRTVPLTVSIGGASAAGADEQVLLAVADRNLYAAKDAGRDLVRVSTPSL